MMKINLESGVQDESEPKRVKIDPETEPEPSKDETGSSNNNALDLRQKLLARRKASKDNSEVKGGEGDENLSLAPMRITRSSAKKLDNDDINDENDDDDDDYMDIEDDVNDEEGSEFDYLQVLLGV